MNFYIKNNEFDFLSFLSTKYALWKHKIPKILGDSSREKISYGGKHYNLICV